MRLHVYHAACWVLGLVAFVQLVLVGAALAVRGNEPSEPRVVERVVTEYVPLPTPAMPQEAPSRAPSPRPFSEPPARAAVSARVAPASPASSIAMMNDMPRPAIADPIVERLVGEARMAKVAGDLVLAILKLEEAQKSDAKEPNVLFELGQVAELLGNYDKAGDYYTEVFQMGVTGGGSLYASAAEKLREGFGADERRQVQVSLGRIQEFRDRRVVEGEKIVLTIPILAAAGQVSDPKAIVPKVIIYDEVGDELVMASETNPPQSKWVSEPVDYHSGEEKLRVSYFIPAAGLADEHLFGARKYFGHVVELYQNGELIDQVAWPRTLAAKVSAPERDPLFLPEEYFPENYNSDNPLLPPLPR
jgi:hypothetical protein